MCAKCLMFIKELRKLYVTVLISKWGFAVTREKTF